MIANSSDAEMKQRIEASVRRVVAVRDLSCDQQDDKWVLRGRVSSRDEALVASIAARTVPGAGVVASEVKV
ncbi:MAG: hypothetical protein AAFN70_16670, partial [Planctomycetota bacterium]